MVRILSRNLTKIPNSCPAFPVYLDAGESLGEILSSFRSEEVSEAGEEPERSFESPFPFPMSGSPIIPPRDGNPSPPRPSPFPFSWRRLPSIMAGPPTAGCCWWWWWLFVLLFFPCCCCVLLSPLPFSWCWMTRSRSRSLRSRSRSRSRFRFFSESPLDLCLLSLECSSRSRLACSLISFTARISFLSFIRRFWNQILIWRSVKQRAWAISIRRRRVR